MSASEAQKTYRDRFVPLNETLRSWLEPFRQGSDLIVHWKRPGEMLMNELKSLREQGREGVPETWPQDVLRHSYGTYRLAVKKSRSEVADEMGNSPEIIKKHYRRPVPERTAEAWFAIKPPDNLSTQVQQWRASLSRLFPANGAGQRVRRC